ncbi:tetratricopeptide repeat protein [Azospirillum tabaci]|uniref:tetratricopeptide repeat protein n=1 Tax=Azospirillum tabaci TaxID=2752310 RepID=UPI001660EFAF|nr:tetratricopeptide repeat protein [Azospirillum tabaci]
MSDIFREVDEDLRRDRMERVFKRYGGIMLAAALAVVAATGGTVAWRNWQQSQKQSETTALAAALSQAAQGPDKGVEALAAFAGKADPGMAALAQLNAAALLAREGKTAEAVAVYDKLSGNAGAGAVYRELAALLSVMHQLESGAPAQLQARLQPLTADNSPWRFSAREMSAVLAARAGDKDRARTLFQQLADDSQAPAGVRSRAADLATLYGKS